MSSAQNQPAIIICSGSFHKPDHYQPLIDVLTARGLEASCPAFPTMAVSDISTDDTSNEGFNALPPPEGWPNGRTDVEVIRREISKLADKGKNVLLVGHGYGGWLATESASPELQQSTRLMEGKVGVVIGIFYISGYILPKGLSIESFFSPQGDASPPPPFATLHAHAKQGLVTPIKAAEYFFHDLLTEEAQAWSSALRAQPVIKSVLNHTSYADVPCGYLVCRNDKAFPSFVQEVMIKTAIDRGGYMETYECTSGHAPFLSWKEGVADTLMDFVDCI